MKQHIAHKKHVYERLKQTQAYYGMNKSPVIDYIMKEYGCGWFFSEESLEDGINRVKKQLTHYLFLASLIENDKAIQRIFHSYDKFVKKDAAHLAKGTIQAIPRNAL